MDAFKDRLSERAKDTGKPALANQSLGRPVTSTEKALAASLMEIYGSGVHDFGEVARALAARKVKAPVSGRTDWDLALLESELVALNKALDAAYQENGYGA